VAPTRLAPDVRRLVAGNTLSALGTGFTLPFLLIYLTKVRGLTLPTAGYAIATLGLVGLASVPLTGALTDRIGAWRVLVLALFAEAAGTAALAGVTRPWHAFLVLAVVGVGGSAAWPAQAALISALVPSEQRSRVFAVQFALLNLGIGLGGAVSGLLVDVGRPETFQAIYLVDACSYLAYVAMLVTIRRSGVPPPRPDRGERTAGGYREVFADRVFLRLGGVALLLSLAGYGQINAGFPAFVSGVAGVSTRVIGFAFAANTAVIVCAQLSVERRLHGRRRTRALAGVALVWAVSWLVIGSAALFGGTLLPAIAVVAGLGLFGLGETLWAPTGAPLVNDIAPEHLRGRYNALSSVTWQLSSVLGPVLAGALLGAGLPAVFILGLTGLLGAVAMLAGRLERHLTPAQNGLFPPADPAARAPTAGPAPPADPVPGGPAPPGPGGLDLTAAVPIGGAPGVVGPQRSPVGGDDPAPDEVARLL
jgi:MFS family permease